MASSTRLSGPILSVWIELTQIIEVHLNISSRRMKLFNSWIKLNHCVIFLDIDLFSLTLMHTHKNMTLCARVTLSCDNIDIRSQPECPDMIVSPLTYAAAMANGSGSNRF